MRGADDLLVLLADRNTKLESEHAAINTYPTLKVSDFGLSQITNDYDPCNPGQIAKGAVDMCPPVSLPQLCSKCLEIALMDA